MFLIQLVVASQRRPQKLWPYCITRRRKDFVFDYERFDLVKTGSTLARSINIIQQTKPTNEDSGTKGIICNNAFTKDPHNVILCEEYTQQWLKDHRCKLLGIKWMPEVRLQKSLLGQIKNRLLDSLSWWGLSSLSVLRANKNVRERLLKRISF